MSRIISRKNIPFLIPGDYPVVGKKVYEDLLNVPGNIVLPMFKGIKGHPVLMDKETIGKLPHASDNNLREFIFSRQYAAIEVHDPGILMDIDTPEDYKRVREYLKRTAWQCHSFPAFR